MARQKVIVKHLAAIENFGSMDVLCSDKTGTLTSGEMVLDRSPRSVRAGRGATARPLAELNSAHETGIKSPLDEAILKHGGVAVTEYRKIDEIPFDFERRRLSVVVESGGERPADHEGRAGGRARRVARRYEIDGAPGPARCGDARRDAQTTYRDAERARARGSWRSPIAVVPLQAAYTAARRARARRSAGFLAFFDPPMEGVTAALAGAPPRRRGGEDPHRRQRAGRPARLWPGRARQCPHRRSAARSSA